uniref:BIG2 domain-containing protein n=1 Tax=candidate division WOR-3 bacterium TaxID=2052148 RepID=A0A7C4YB17_UNCW3
MLNLFISLMIIVSPEPIKCVIENPVKIEVKVFDENNNPVEAKINLSLSPVSIGIIENFTFIPKTAGDGVLKIKAEYNGEEKIKIVYISVKDTLFGIKKITPDFVLINTGENVKFEAYGGEVLRWKVLPENIGTINNDGFFTAVKTGRGRVVAIFSDGDVLSARIIVGKDIEKVKIIPSIVKINLGETYTFKTDKEIEEVRWEVLPKSIGEIDENGLFIPRNSGRGIVSVRGKINGKDVFGSGIVIVLGERNAVIFPKKVFVKKDESVKFTVKDKDGKEIKDVKWKVIPKRMGGIQDGIFVPVVNMGKGKIVAILPEGYKPRVLSADFVILPERNPLIILRPRFAHINLGENVQYSVDFLNMNDIPVKYEVYPKDLGEITQSGIFTPKRNGAGVIVARTIDELGIKPANAFIIVGEIQQLDISPKYIELYEDEVVKFRINSPIPEDVEILWIVHPQGGGTISKDGYFKAGKCPQGNNEVFLKIIAIAHKRFQIISFGSATVKVKRRR